MDFSGGMGWGLVASTLTDATGRYVLCNLGTPQLGIHARRLEAWVQVRLRSCHSAQTVSFEVELERQSGAG